MTNEEPGALRSDVLREGATMALCFIAVVGYVAARSVPLSRSRSLGYVAGVVVLTLAILWIETLFNH